MQCTVTHYSRTKKSFEWCPISQYHDRYERTDQDHLRFRSTSKQVDTVCDDVVHRSNYLFCE